MRTITKLALFAFLSSAAFAQAPDAAHKELGKKEVAAGRDPEALLRVGQWARERGLADDAKRIFQNVLKLVPDHKAANEAVGNELVDGVWLSAKDAEGVRKRARDAEFLAKGLVEVDGIWVRKEQADDARKGLFRVGDQVVTKDEFRELSGGKVRHPVTGEIIEAKDLESAKSRHFPIGKDNRWVDESEADRFHADLARPWIVRTKHYVFVTTLPIAKIESVKEHADRAISRLQPILGFATARPTERPTILVAANADEFRRLGNSMGDAASAFGAFLAQDGALLTVPLQGDVRPVVCLWDEGWGPYNLPHAVGLAHVNSICAELDTEVPAWFLHAMGSFASRFESLETGAWFAQRLAKAGGLKDLGSWFRTFAISGSMEFDAIDAAMTQAGLIVSFCISGKDEDATKAIQGVTAAFSSSKASAIDRAIKSLQATLAGKQGQVADYLVRMVKERG